MPLSIQKRWELVFLIHHHRGPKLGVQEAARELRVDRKTVKHWLQIYEATNNVEDMPRAGRPRATSAKEDTDLVRFAESHHQATAADIAGRLKRKRVIVSDRTVRRRLREAELEPLKSIRKPLLNKRLRHARLKWAKENTQTK